MRTSFIIDIDKYIIENSREVWILREKSVNTPARHHLKVDLGILYFSLYIFSLLFITCSVLSVLIVNLLLEFLFRLNVWITVATNPTTRVTFLARQTSFCINISLLSFSFLYFVCLNLKFKVLICDRYPWSTDFIVLAHFILDILMFLFLLFFARRFRCVWRSIFMHRKHLAVGLSEVQPIYFLIRFGVFQRVFHFRNLIHFYICWSAEQLG